jgi:acyl dehydratase
MPLDPSLTGKSYPSTAPYEVGREKIREFAGAIGAPEAAYRDPEAAKALGYPDLIAPPTFAAVLSPVLNQMLIDDPELGLDFSRVVHGDQRFAYARPVRAGDRLVADVTIEEIMSRAGNDFITTRAEISTDDGELVLTLWSRLVVRAES